MSTNFVISSSESHFFAKEKVEVPFETENSGISPEDALVSAPKESIVKLHSDESDSSTPE